MQENQQVLRTAEVIRRCGIARTTLWRMERAGQFPRRRQLSSRTVGWLAADVDAWILSRAPAGPQEGTATARVSP